jgi:hypothetical protein
MFLDIPLSKFLSTYSGTQKTEHKKRNTEPERTKMASTDDTYDDDLDLGEVIDRLDKLLLWRDNVRLRRLMAEIRHLIDDAEQEID